MEAASFTSKMPPGEEPSDPYGSFLSDSHHKKDTGSVSTVRILGSTSSDLIMMDTPAQNFVPPVVSSSISVPQEASKKIVPQEAPVRKTVPQEAPVRKGVPQEAPAQKGVPQEAPNSDHRAQQLPAFIELVSSGISTVKDEVKEHLSMEALHGAFKSVKDEFNEHVGSAVPQMAKMLGDRSNRASMIPYVDMIPTSGSAISENLKIVDASRANPVEYDVSGKIVAPKIAATNESPKIPKGEGVPKGPEVLAAAGVQFVDVVPSAKGNARAENAKIMESSRLVQENSNIVATQNMGMLQQSRAASPDAPIGVPVVNSFTQAVTPQSVELATSSMVNSHKSIENQPNFVDLVDSRTVKQKSVKDKAEEVAFVDVVSPISTAAVKSGFRRRILRSGKKPTRSPSHRTYTKKKKEDDDNDGDNDDDGDDNSSNDYKRNDQIDSKSGVNDHEDDNEVDDSLNKDHTRNANIPVTPSAGSSISAFPDDSFTPSASQGSMENHSISKSSYATGTVANINNTDVLAHVNNVNKSTSKTTNANVGGSFKVVPAIPIAPNPSSPPTQNSQNSNQGNLEVVPNSIVSPTDSSPDDIEKGTITETDAKTGEKKTSSTEIDFVDLDKALSSSSQSSSSGSVDINEHLSTIAPTVSPSNATVTATPSLSGTPMPSIADTTSPTTSSSDSSSITGSNLPQNAVQKAEIDSGKGNTVSKGTDLGSADQIAKTEVAINTLDEKSGSPSEIEDADIKEKDEVQSETPEANHNEGEEDEGEDDDDVGNKGREKGRKGEEGEEEVSNAEGKNSQEDDGDSRSFDGANEFRHGGRSGRGRFGRGGRGGPRGSRDEEGARGPTNVGTGDNPPATASASSISSSSSSLPTGEKTRQQLTPVTPESSEVTPVSGPEVESDLSVDGVKNDDYFTTFYNKATEYSQKAKDAGAPYVEAAKAAHQKAKDSWEELETGLDFGVVLAVNAVLIFCIFWTILKRCCCAGHRYQPVSQHEDVEMTSVAHDLPDGVDEEQEEADKRRVAHLRQREEVSRATKSDDDWDEEDWDDNEDRDTKITGLKLGSKLSVTKSKGHGRIVNKESHIPPKSRYGNRPAESKNRREGGMVTRLAPSPTPEKDEWDDDFDVDEDISEGKNALESYGRGRNREDFVN